MHPECYADRLHKMFVNKIAFKKWISPTAGPFEMIDIDQNKCTDKFCHSKETNHINHIFRNKMVNDMNKPLCKNL